MGDLASVMLEGEVTDAKSKRLPVAHSRPHIPRESRFRVHFLRCRSLESAGMRKSALGSLMRESPGDEGERLGMGSPWVGDGHGVITKVGATGCLQCELQGTCCARCAIRVVHATLAPMAARTSLPKRGA